MRAAGVQAVRGWDAVRAGVIVVAVRGRPGLFDWIAAAVRLWPGVRVEIALLLLLSLAEGLFSGCGLLSLG